MRIDNLSKRFGKPKQNKFAITIPYGNYGNMKLYSNKYHKDYGIVRSQFFDFNITNEAIKTRFPNYHSLQ